MLKFGAFRRFFEIVIGDDDFRSPRFGGLNHGIFKGVARVHFHVNIGRPVVNRLNQQGAALVVSEFSGAARGD